MNPWLYDDIVCDYPLPDGYDPEDGGGFQTKSLDCRMDTYLITEEGRLMNMTPGELELVPEEERFYYGKPEWGNEDSLYRLFGAFRRKEEQPKDMEYHGDVIFYDTTPAGWREYTAHFTNGQLEWIKGGVTPSEQSQATPE